MFSFAGTFLLFLLLIWRLDLTEAKQSFDREPEHSEVNPGEDTVLTCRIFDKHRNSICNWLKNGLLIRIQNGKYEWEGNRDAGDCSLRVHEANINFDNAEWICQVSPSSFDASDGLSSRTARLIVRIPPSPPRIYYNGDFLSSEKSLQVAAGQRARLRCESRGGNPAPLIKWFIDDQELLGSKQTNQTELNDDWKWNAVSHIEIPFRKDYHRKTLKCVAYHEAYPRRTMEETTTLDVLYAPIVKLERAKSGFEFEADIDQLQIRCLADSNPPSNIFWRKAGGESILRLGETLEFNPVRKGDSGTYFCMAKNEVGSSDELSVTFDVLYRPKKVNISPKRLIDLDVGSSAEFKCDSEANPPAQFQWIQKLSEENILLKPKRGSSSGNKNNNGRMISRGLGKTMLLQNVTYENEGKWICVATNSIKGIEKSVKSSALDVEVVGKPQILHYKTQERQDFARHSDAIIKVIFCSDPKPRSLHWTWGSLQLNEGETRGRFKASNKKPYPNKKDCYYATLTISKMISGDARFYTATIANERGRSEYDIHVRVLDPVPMTALVGVIATAFCLVLFIIFCVAYSFKTRKCCFKHKGGPAFQRDNNFRIYPNDNYIAERLPNPPTLISQRQLPKEQPLGIPTISRPFPKEATYFQKEPIIPAMNGTAVTTSTTVPRKRSEATYSKQVTYPLPPSSQFALGTAARPSGFGTVVRKTPQNADLPGNGGINFPEFKEHHTNGDAASNFASKLRTSTSSIPGGEESHYYPRARDRADV